MPHEKPLQAAKRLSALDATKRRSIPETKTTVRRSSKDAPGKGSSKEPLVRRTSKETPARRLSNDPLARRTSKDPLPKRTSKEKEPLIRRTSQDPSCNLSHETVKTKADTPKQTPSTTKLSVAPKRRESATKKVQAKKKSVADVKRRSSKGGQTTSGKPSAIGVKSLTQIKAGKTTKRAVSSSNLATTQNNKPKAADKKSANSETDLKATNQDRSDNSCVQQLFTEPLTESDTLDVIHSRASATEIPVQSGMAMRESASNLPYVPQMPAGKTAIGEDSYEDFEKRLRSMFKRDNKIVCIVLAVTLGLQLIWMTVLIVLYFTVDATAANSGSCKKSS